MKTMDVSEDMHLELCVRCLTMAAVAPDDRTRTALLHFARLYEREAESFSKARLALSQSREAIAKAHALLGGSVNAGGEP